MVESIRANVIAPRENAFDRDSGEAVTGNYSRTVEEKNALVNS